MELQLGQKAPDFTLYDSDKNKVSLSDYQGSAVLLLFFPLAFTSVCTAEMCSIRDNLKIYEDLNLTPLGISVDSLYTLKKFKEEQNLSFRLLSDFNKEVSKLYNSFYESFSYGMHGVSKRAVFLIDKQGVIQHIEILENAGLQPNFVEVKKKAEAFR
jgi:glutaredoxin-dependent peroxiredoxin